MNEPLDAIKAVATQLMAEAQACLQADLALRLRERAATLRGAAASLARLLESLTVPPEAKPVLADA